MDELSRFDRSGDDAMTRNHVKYVTVRLQLYFGYWAFWAAKALEIQTWLDIHSAQRITLAHLGSSRDSTHLKSVTSYIV